MNPLALAFLLLSGGALLKVPRRWAPLPLLAGACYMTLEQGIDVGPLNFTLIRILILFGWVRVLVRGERLAGGLNGLDRLMLLWGFFAVISVFSHKDFTATLINRLGLVYNWWGIYFLLRIFCQSFEDILSMSAITGLVLVPVAAEMISEKVTGHNMFSILGGVSPSPAVREGRLRAQGPFGHAILAGTVGAAAIPMLFALWRMKRKEGKIGLAAALTMVVTCASSGPIMTALTGAFGMFMWRFRDRMKMVRGIAIGGYIFLSLVMTAPTYYIIARINIVGGSTGYHRAKLIESAFQHLDEWWLGGTDYTRHWMRTGVSWSPDHTDITNHYLKLGVLGGLPLMLAFIAILLKGFACVGRALKQAADAPQEVRFMMWAFGATLFAHAATCVSVAYFDQSFVFLGLNLGAIGSLASVSDRAVSDAEREEQDAHEQMDESWEEV